ncbi:OmpA family protein [Spirosoma taeanense]|uniref:OmpA family protein n=1 Tax=Spirosoma taeanense TaxID=2735870 RepID=A0A6M5Y924_9BACT|nr:OmpA family protein [Spirosoma taeanense]QJW90788.1 OmpA family protein [Spirosoma taeanense]
MIRFLTIWLSVISLLAQGQQVDSSCFRLQGRLIDLATHQPLNAAQLVAKTLNGRQKISTSSQSGTFSAALPCGTTDLYIERIGYRSHTIPIRLFPSQQNMPVTVLIPLIPVDRQNQDKPYLQTEQTSYVQTDSITDQSVRDNNRVQHNTFLITDAIQGKPLSATVCLFYTKTGEKRCLGTNAQGWLQRDFDQKDIIALEIRSIGYQPYDGNLIVEQLNGQFLRHEIRLQRELTLFSVNAPEATRCELRTKAKTVALVAMTGYPHQYVAYDLSPGPYELVVNYGVQVIRQPVHLNTGLNYMSVDQPSMNPVSTPAPVSPSVPVAVKATVEPLMTLPDSLPMIYFEQGSYQLRPDSQDVLRQIAQYMKSHPAYTLQITGHTDNVGNPQINQTLSIYRALVTARFLANLGVAENLLTKDGIGSRQPIAPNDTEDNRALNRRVSLKLRTAQ